MTDTAADRNILDLPNEILVEIILHLNARERLALGNSCKRLNSLIFEDKKSLRDLDFAEEGYLTSTSGVQQYFNNKTKYDHIRRINVSNIYCTRPTQMLANICKAKNLVEVNITGLKFKDFEHLSRFLKPLEQLKKFAADWPTGVLPDKLCRQLFKEPFGRLTHLSMTLSEARDKLTLISALELCQELEELHMIQTYECSITGLRMWMQTPERMPKLRLVTYYGSDTQLLDSVVIHLLSDPEQWTKFQSFGTGNVQYFHYEKNVAVSQELREDVRRILSPPRTAMAGAKVGWSLCFESLLQNVIRIAHHAELVELNCLGRYIGPDTCLLRIKDTTLLLKNPRHKISYLNLVHDINHECDIHLVALKFPSLTKLVLSNITRPRVPVGSETDKTGFKRKRVASEKQNETQDPHPSFKKLVENTPQLKDFTLFVRELEGYKMWDLMALQLISGWKNLTTLYLANLPIRSGQFLIEIGKECVNLEKLRLENLGARGACCYKNTLLQMLAHCHNLKDFSIEQSNLGQVSHIFTTFAENPKLRRVRVKSLGTGNDVSNITPPVVKLIRSTMPILLVCEIEGMTKVACDKLRSILQRLKIALDRPNFQFVINSCTSSDKFLSQFSQLELVHRDLLLPHSFVDTVFRLDF